VQGFPLPLPGHLVVAAAHGHAVVAQGEDLVFRADDARRSDYINWDEYFMGIALLTAMRSKDPNSQVGACIVSPENKILSLGYNGMPMDAATTS